LTVLADPYLADVYEMRVVDASALLGHAITQLRSR
jgi:hypothetical protein